MVLHISATSIIYILCGSSEDLGLAENDEITVSAILYKGLCLGDITPNAGLSVTTTGDIEVYSNKSLKIRGAGTVTINPAQP